MFTTVISLLVRACGYFRHLVSLEYDDVVHRNRTEGSVIEAYGTRKGIKGINEVDSLFWGFFLFFKLATLIKDEIC